MITRHGNGDIVLLEIEFVWFLAIWASQSNFPSPISRHDLPVDLNSVEVLAASDRAFELKIHVTSPLTSPPFPRQNSP
jgi:hypothetical protein